MRNFKENVNIIEQFMTKGCVSFYIPYYLDGEDFVKQIHITKKDVKDTIKDTETAVEDFENGIIDEEGLIEDFAKNSVLRWIMEVEKEETTFQELKLFQYIADIIVGQPDVMFEMTKQIAKQEYVDEKIIEIADSNVYSAICRMLMSIEETSKNAEEEKD